MSLDTIANDVAKYFAIIPAMFAPAFPVLNALNIMGLRTPQSAILSAVIFNALIIIALIPLALKGVKYRPMSAARLLRRNLLIYGLAGVVVPFIGIKIIDVVIHAIGSARHRGRTYGGRQFGFLGEPRVNVLELNLDLDNRKPIRH